MLLLLLLLFRFLLFEPNQIIFISIYTSEYPKQERMHCRLDVNSAPLTQKKTTKKESMSDAAPNFELKKKNRWTLVRGPSIVLCECPLKILYFFLRKKIAQFTHSLLPNRHTVIPATKRIYIFLNFAYRMARLSSDCTPWWMRVWIFQWIPFRFSETTKHNNI